MPNQGDFQAAMVNYWRGQIRYPENCDRIVDVAQQQFGIGMSRWEAQIVWEAHSDDYFAGWLVVSDDDEIALAIKKFIESHAAGETDK
jgi:hypothetical protein